MTDVGHRVGHQNPRNPSLLDATALACYYLYHFDPALDLQGGKYSIEKYREQDPCEDKNPSLSDLAFLVEDMKQD